MKRLMLALTISALCGAASAQGEADPVSAYQAALKEFGTALKSELQAAIKEGGPVAGITVCNTKAGDIADKYSRQYGWKIGRTSLKTRNPANAPTPEQKEVLISWEQVFKPGGNPAELQVLDTIEVNGEMKQLYMQGVGVAEVCVTCHGADVAPEIEAKLKELYPQDQARGYKPSDLRGAFYIIANEPEK